MRDDAVVIGGKGTVGNATRKALKIKYYFDKKDSNIGLNEAHHKCLFVFICLPTPVVEGEYKTDEITAIVKQMASMGSRNIFVIRSTVAPGYGRWLHSKFDVPVVSHPEFGNEDTMLKDMKDPDLVVLGADSDSYWALERVRNKFYSDFDSSKIIATDNVTAEQIKVTLNAFYAMKVIFANEVYDNCENTLANYELVKYALEHSRYGSRNHFDIFHKGGRGAGGKCLKKDFEFFARFTNSPLFLLADKINKSLLESTNKK
ncbi:MAG: nucleotide sugar dehydrogenase [Podoviridae sp. ctg2L5]|nr:MAG: nucleotide sugar dehydrogenase [Podoviridae sp. ctg2L5]